MRRPSARGRWRCALAFPNGGSWDSHPTPPSACAKSPRSLCLDCSCARRGGRLLRWLLNRVSRLRTISGLLARSGATRAAKQHHSGRLRRCPSGSAYSQNRARRFSTKQACRKTAPLPEHRFATRYRSGDIRSVFRLRRASPPKLGHCPCGARRAVARVGGVARGGDAEAL